MKSQKAKIQIDLRISDPDVHSQESMFEEVKILKKSLNRLFWDLNETSIITSSSAKVTSPNNDLVLSKDKAAKSGGTLIGLLQAEVSLNNLGKVINFIGQKFKKDPIKIQIEIGNKAVTIKINSLHDLIEAEQSVKRLIRELEQ